MPEAMELPLSHRTTARFAEREPVGAHSPIRTKGASPYAFARSPTLVPAMTSSAMDVAQSGPYVKSDEFAAATAIKPRQTAALAASALTAGAFATWFVLMIAVAVEGGSALQIAAITMIPFLAHVASLLLKSSRTPHQAD
jgi:hypothetical protein